MSPPPPPDLARTSCEWPVRMSTRTRSGTQSAPATATAVAAATATSAATTMQRKCMIKVVCPAVPIPDLLHELLTTPGPSGHEGPAAAVWRSAAEEFAEVTADVLGSSTARVKGTGDGPTLAIVGHIDEIGLAI